MPIQTPLNSTANNNGASLLRGTFSSRVSGQPLYLADLNCHCYDPSKTFVLNAAAWENPANGQFGSAAGYVNDYRYQRRPSESLNFGRTFKWGPESRFNLNVRAEFSNVMNRVVINDPQATAPQTPQSSVNGLTTAGFGFINRSIIGTQVNQPRQGTLVARFSF